MRNKLVSDETLKAYKDCYEKMHKYRDIENYIKTKV